MESSISQFNHQAFMLIPHYLHLVTAAIAAGGLFQAVRWRLKQLNGERNTRRKIQIGLYWFSSATIIQMAIGFWFLASLPMEKMLLFLGGNAWATSLLAMGLMGAAISLMMALKGRVWFTAWATIGTVAVMVLMHNTLRSSHRSSSLLVSPADLMVPEYLSIVLLMVSFVVGIALVFHLMKPGADIGK